MLIFMLITLVLINTPNNFESSVVLENYVKKIERLSKGNIKSKVQINFADLKYPVIGTCYDRAIKYIEIDKAAFDYFTEKKRLLIIAHELGHCACGLDHINGYGTNGCPAHFMHEAAGDYSCIRRNWNRYVKQMKELDC